MDRIKPLIDKEFFQIGRTFRRQVAGALLCLLNGSVLAAPQVAVQATASWQTHHATVIEAAREGSTGWALEELRSLHHYHPLESAIRLDYGVVAAWHGEDQTAVDVLTDVAVEELPVYVLSAFAKAARNVQRWALAAHLYEHLARRGPDTYYTGLVGQLLSLADAGAFDAGQQLYHSLPNLPAPQTGDYADLQFACGYLHERARKFVAALHCYNRGLRHHPEHPELRRRRALVASAIGAAGVAARELADSPALFTANEQTTINLDAAAMRIRWSNLVPVQQQLRAAEQALAAYPQPGLTTASDNPVLLFDRFVAQATAYRMQAAEQSYQNILQRYGPQQNLPSYVLANAGHVYLYLQQPRIAVELFKLALDKAGDRQSANDRFSMQMGLFNALADAAEYEQLAELVKQLQIQEVAWIRPTPRIWIANHRFTTAAEAAVLEQAYREDYNNALSGMDSLLAIAPANGGMRLSRAAIARWRGWYRQSRADIEKVAVTGEYRLRSTVDAGHVALDTQDYAAAELALHTAREIHPRDKAVIDLQQRWQLHQTPEFSIQAGSERSDGDRLGSRGYQIASQLHTAPFATHYRAYTRGVSRFAQFAEGDGRDVRLGAGIEYRRPGLTVQAEVNRGAGQFKQTGAVLEATWHISDYWFTSASTARHSIDIPLRGLRAGISGDALRASLGYRWHESRQTQLSIGATNLDDGNQRRWLAWDYRQRWWHNAQHKLSANLQVYTSRNSNRDSLYFNPQSDQDTRLGVTHEWRIWRDYDRSLTQRIDLTFGRYYQEDFGANPLWQLRWEQLWQLSPRLQFSYGVAVGRRHYDGDAERQRQFFISGSTRL